MASVVEMPISEKMRPADFLSLGSIRARRAITLSTGYINAFIGKGPA